MNHKGTITLETDRLILRKFNVDDVNAAFLNWAGDEKVTEFLRWSTHGNIGVTEYVLNMWIAEYEKMDFYQWAIVSEVNGGIPDLQVKPFLLLSPFSLSRLELRE